MGKKFKRGEIVLAADSSDSWLDVIYLATIKWAKSPYYCVNVLCVDEFKKWEPFKVQHWKRIKKIPKLKKYTKEELEEKIWEKFILISNSES